MLDERPEKISAHEVAVWLRRHPEFLGQFPDLVTSLMVPKQDGKTATLSSYQLEILRDKNKELTRRLHELGQNALDNERLSQLVHELSLALLRARTPSEVVHTFAACLIEDFAGESVRIIAFTPIPGLSESWFNHVTADDPRLAPFADCLVSEEPICGRLNPEKLPLLFGEDRGFAQSVALIPVGRIGLIAVGSADPHRFYPGMGTLFLRWIGELFHAAMTHTRR